jgi:hypothetical protein
MLTLFKEIPIFIFPCKCHELPTKVNFYFFAKYVLFVNKIKTKSCFLQATTTTTKQINNHVNDFSNVVRLYSIDSINGFPIHHNYRQLNTIGKFIPIHNKGKRKFAALW